MKNFKELRQEADQHKNLTESFKNLFDKDSEERKKYAGEVWNILQTSYAKIGGIKGNGFRSIDDMIASIPFWKLSIRNGTVTAVAMYKDTNGRKRVAIGTNGTPQGKADIANILVADMRQYRAYAEVSDASLAFIKKQFSEQEMAKYFVPVEVVKSKVFPYDEIRPVSKFSYMRLIGNEWKEKVMIGNVNAPRIL